MKRKAISAQRAVALWALVILIFVLLCPQIIQAGSSDLVISEIMYDLDGSDSGREWIEVYNGGSENIEVLTGSGANAWRFFDGSNHILNLANGTSTIAVSEYFIIASDAQNFLTEHPGFALAVFDTVMSLGNSSSTIALSFDGGQTQSISAGYDATWGASGNGKTLEKINLTQESAVSNWQESSVLGGTPGAVKSQGTDLPPLPPDDGSGDDDPPADEEPEPPASEAPVSGGTRAPSNYWSQIKISELLPNPVGSDDAEWIELFNQGQNTVDLSGFKVQDNSAGQYTIGQGLLLAGNSYLVLYKNQTKISLNNTGGDSVKVYSPDNNLLDSAVYAASAPEGKSWALINGSLAWTPSPTPGQANVLPENQAPQAMLKIEGDKFFANAKIIFLGSESVDPEEGELKYFWDFGDNQNGDEAKENHVYEKAGNYLIKLKVTDSTGLSNEVTKNIVVENKAVDLKLADVKSIDFRTEDLLITEVLPNPVGNDDAEWIELYNASAKNIDLVGWQLDDEEGGSKAYVFATSTIISAGSFLVIDRNTSQITLNNTADSVRLLTPLNEVWQEVKYEKIPEGQSYAWDLANNEWFVSESPCPGQANIMNTLQAASENLEYKKGENRNITATVWGQNNKILYLLDYENRLVEVYGALDFAKYKRGDAIYLSGKITRVDPWPRVKIVGDQEISILDSEQEIIKPDITDSADLNEEYNGQLVIARGVVVKKNGKNIYLADDVDQEYNLRLSLKFDTKDLKLDKGTEVIASGLLQFDEKVVRLDVFDKSDLQMEQKVLGEKILTSTSSTSTVGANQGSSQVKKILKFVLLGFLIISIFYVLITKLKKKK
jgi:PKD repeat protein